jgi:hypothetical protein
MDMGLWICIYGYVFMVMGLRICMDVFGYVFLAICYGCVSGYVYGFVWASGLGSPQDLVQQTSRLTSPWGPFPSSLGLTPSRGPLQ